MTELQQNRYDKLLRRVGGLIGAKSMVSDALGELFPVIDVENQPAENLFLMGTKIAVCGSQLNVNAGDTNHHQLFNPAESQVVAAITSVWVNTNTSQSVRFSPSATAIGTDIGGARVRDLRVGVANIPVCQNRTVQQVGGIPLTFQIRAIADEEIPVHDPNGIFVLFPGTGLTVATTTVATLSTVNFFWRERVFEGAENQFSG